MPDAEARQKLEDLAQEVFNVTTMSFLVRSRSKASASGQQLSEAEFLTLDVLAKESPQTVGAIQKAVGVLPAQMSRIIRALESKDGEALVSCEINPDDRRRINVKLTAVGRKAYQSYRQARLSLTMQILSELLPEDREEFIRILRLMRQSIAKRMNDK
ncbi:MAG: MarR family transcriptional regulator [Phycisphaerae bacterium]|nr:MarR family transcriptional regulator [Phycisphaerae bacterium]